MKKYIMRSNEGKIESGIFFMRLDLMQLELSAERKKREKLMEKSGRWLSLPQRRPCCSVWTIKWSIRKCNREGSLRKNCKKLMLYMMMMMITHWSPQVQYSRLNEPWKDWKGGSWRPRCCSMQTVDLCPYIMHCHTRYLSFPGIFIGPKSDHWECLSVTP